MIAWLLTNTLTAALFAGLVWMVIRVGRPAPGVRHALWLIVLLKLVSPVEFFWSVPVPVRPSPVMEDAAATVELSLAHSPPAYGLITEEMIDVPLDENSRPVFVHEEAAPEEALVVSTVDETLPTPRPDDSRRWEWWVLFVWMGGAMVTLWRLTRDTWRFGRFARLAKNAPDALVAEVAVVANRMSLRTPVVRMLAGLSSPVMWCLGRPVLLWPAELETQLGSEGRRAVIAHELAHLRRRDHWVRWLEMLAGVVHWWNPVYWLARRRLRADAELACDQWATSQADRRTYAEALLAVCVFQPRRRPAPAVGVLGEGKREIQERLTQIMTTTTPGRTAFAARLCVVLFGLAAIPALTLGQAPAKPESTAAPVTPEASTIDLKDVLLITAAPEDAELMAIQEQIKALSMKLEALRMAKMQKHLKENPPNPVKPGADREAQALKERLLEERALMEKLRAAEQKATAEELEKRATKRAEVLKAPPAGKSPVATWKIVPGTNVMQGFGADGQPIPGVTVTFSAPGTSPKPGMATTQYGFADPKVPAGSIALPPMVATPAVAPLPPKPGQPVPTAERPTTIRMITAPATPGTITLSRATYKLPKEQAATLLTLLNGFKKVVMETKLENDTLIVTTTPESQQVIQGLVKLMTGEQSQTFHFKLGLDLGEKQPPINLKWSEAKPQSATTGTTDVPPALPGAGTKSSSGLSGTIEFTPMKPGTTKTTDPVKPGATKTTDPEKPVKPGATKTTDPEKPVKPGTTKTTDPEKPMKPGATKPTDPEKPMKPGATKTTDPVK